MCGKPLGPLILDLTGEDLQDEERDLLQSPAVGGVILFSRNFASLEQLSNLVFEIRRCRSELLVCVDHEGGRVQRFRDGFTRIPAMQRIAAYPDLIKDTAWLLASELIAFDIDFSFAPVLDADTNFSTVIGDRSFSSDPRRVLQLAETFIQGMASAGMAAVGKHFPGHGGVSADSHLELPSDARDFNSLQQHDLLPFYHLRSQLDGMMPAHILFPMVDSQYPVGFSKHWLQSVLRRDWGYTGVIFSDDLSMEGAAKYGDYAMRAHLALDAGCDAILVCNCREGAEQVIAKLESQPMIRASQLGNMRRKTRVRYQDLIKQRRWQRTSEDLQKINACG